MTDAKQVRDSKGKVLNPGQNDSEHWQIRLAAGGVIQAEAFGKVVVLTDYIFDPIDAGSFHIREKDGSGTILVTGRCPAASHSSHSFREGIEGAAYNGSNAGDLYFEFLAGGGAATFTGYMKNA